MYQSFKKGRTISSKLREDGGDKKGKRKLQKTKIHQKKKKQKETPRGGQKKEKTPRHGA